MWVRPFAWNNSAPTGWIFIKFDIWVFFENLSRIFQFHQHLIRITGTFDENQYTFMICRSVLLKMRHPSDIRYRENQTIYFMLNNFLFLKIVPLWDNVEICGTPRQVTDGNIIRCMRFACWITKTTEAHSEYIIIIVFPTATLATRTRLNVTLYVHCLSRSRFYE